MDLEIAELALHHEDASGYLGMLERDIGKGLDIETGGHLDDLGSDIRPGQRASHPAAEIAHGLRLQAVEEDE